MQQNDSLVNGAGSTPIPTYEALVKFVKAGELSFKNVVTFNMDECAVSPLLAAARPAHLPALCRQPRLQHCTLLQ